MFFTISPRAKKLEARRLQAGRYFSHGKSQAWVADRMRVTTAATCKWHARWKDDKVKGLKSKGRCGVKKSLTKKNLKTIRATLDKGPLKAGFPNDLWTLERVRTVMKREAKKSFHIGYVWKILTRDLGWSNQKPSRRARERNEAAIARWVKIDWPAIQKRGHTPMQPSDSSMNPASQTVR
jgi:putative transposase